VPRGQKKTRTFRIWDDEVEIFFREYGNGRTVAAYFECLRYRQQLTPRKPFNMSSKDIERITGLGMWQQQNSRRLLEASGWIETRLSGRGYEFVVTDTARDAIRHLPHKISPEIMYKNYGFSTGKRRV
jgi:hypothetical protein